MPDIKSRDVVSGTIKAVDRSALAGQRMKDAYVQAKNKAEHSVYSLESNSEEYASEQITNDAATVAREAVHQVDVRGHRIIHGAQKQFTQHNEKQKSRQSTPENPQAPPNTPQSEQNTPTVQQPHRVFPNGTVTPANDMDSKAGSGITISKQEAVRNQQIAAAKSELRAKRASQRIATSEPQMPPSNGILSTATQEKSPGSIHNPAAKTINTVERTNEAIKQSAKSAENISIKVSERTIKTAGSTVKTVEYMGSTAIKSTQVAAETAQKTAVETARTVQRIRAAAKVAETTAKAVAATTVKAVKAIITAAQQLVSVIAAGGWVAVLVLAVILMVGLIVGSSFGIFFSSQDTGEGELMKDVIQEINTEYQDELDALRENIEHDEVKISGSRAVWPEVLSIYAVMVTSDPDNPMEVATMDDTKKAILEDIFWQMNEITYEEESREEMELTETDDGEGNIVEEWTEVTKDYLLITVEHKTAEEMADILGFNVEQKELLAQLLDEEYDSLWVSVLYGINAGDGMIVEVAMSQIGNVGGQPYWSWYGFESRVEWCACFVSRCANECGYIEAGIIPKFAGCINGVQWFKERGQWSDNSAEPIPGMIIFFDWEDESDGGDLDGQPDHVGIVEKVENGRVYTIEGNTSDSCRERSYPVGYYEILGYGIPAY